MSNEEDKKLESWNKFKQTEFQNNKFEIVKKELIKDYIEQMKQYAKYLNKPVEKTIDGKTIIIYPDGKIRKNISLDDFL